MIQSIPSFSGAGKSGTRTGNSHEPCWDPELSVVFDLLDLCGPRARNKNTCGICFPSGSGSIIGFCISHSYFSEHNVINSLISLTVLRQLLTAGLSPQEVAKLHWACPVAGPWHSMPWCSFFTITRSGYFP